MAEIHLPLAAIDAFARRDARALARKLGLRPWQINPIDVHDGPCPYSHTSAGAASWPQAQRVRHAFENAIAARKVREH